MPAESDSELFYSTIGTTRGIWRDLAHWLDAHERALRARLSPDLPFLLWAHAVAEGARRAQFVADRFGRDITSRPCGELPNRCDPQGDEQETAFIVAVREYLLFAAMRRSLEEVVAPRPPEQRPEWAVKVYIESYRYFLAFLAEREALHPLSERHRNAAIVAVAGRVRDNLKTTLGRVSRALNTEAQGDPEERERVLCELLPSATVLALSAPADGPWDPRVLVNRVSNIIAEEGTLQGKTMTATSIVQLDDEASTFSAEQEFWAEEEATLARADAGALIERAHLSRRERQVFDLDLQGRTGKEIGDTLGITEGAAKSNLFRARQKLGRAAGSR